MDRTILKQSAKNAIQRDRVICCVVAFIMTLVGAGAGQASGLPTLNFNFNVNNAGTGSSGNFPNSFQYALDNPEEYLPYLIPVFAGIAVVALIAALIGLLLGSVIGVGGNRYFLKLRAGEATGVGEIAGNFKDGNYANILIANFIAKLKIFLWSLLFIIPGMIKSYELFPVNYILAVRPDLDRATVFDLCKKIMNGKKLDLFVLQLSFIGWSFLNIFTCGILGIVYLNAYMQATFTEFFIAVKDDAVRSGIISSADIPDYGTYSGGYGGSQGGGFNPNAGGFNPNAGGFNPNAGGFNPNAGGFNPNAGGYNPNAGGFNPNAGGFNPNAGGYNPYGNPNGGFDPNAGGFNPYGAPNPNGGSGYNGNNNNF